MQFYDITKNKSMEMQAHAKELNTCLVSDFSFIERAKDYKKEISQARKKYNLIIALGRGNPKENREIVEACPDVLLSPEKGSRKDYMRERGSGLDHITCKIATQKKVAIGIDFSEILNTEDKDKILGRIMQNIKLCRKYKTDMLLATFASSLLEMRAPKDLIAFAQAIGMTPSEAKKSLQIVEKIIRRNKEKRKPEYVSEGIRIVE